MAVLNRLWWLFPLTEFCRAADTVAHYRVTKQPAIDSYLEVGESTPHTSYFL
jgi:hypothetical protein